MTYEPVDVCVQDHRSAPMPGAVIRVYDPGGRVFFTEGETDETGRAGFLLETARYSLRFHRALTRIDQPRAIEVVESGENVFTVEAIALSASAPSSPRLCRVTGTLRASNGAPIRNAIVRHTPLFDALTEEDETVVATLGRSAANERGEMDFELYQGAAYRLEVDASVAPAPALARELVIPRRPHASLSELLFPTPEFIAWGSTAAVTLDVGAAATQTPKVWSRAGEELRSLGGTMVTWSTTDTDVAVVRTSGPYVVIEGRSPGVTEITARRSEGGAEVALDGAPLEVVVR